MNDISLQDVMAKFFDLEEGHIVDVDLDKEIASVKVNGITVDNCAFYFPNAHSNLKKSIAWGLFDYPSIGDIVLIFKYKNQPYIIKNLSGYKNIQSIYKEGKLQINRISDEEDEDTSLEEELRKGELFLRSLGMGDIFLDKLGNIIVDTHKEIIFRIGDRDNGYKISEPEIILRVGRIKDDNGEEKKDNEDKKIKVELQLNNETKLILNEDGVWKLGSESADQSYILGDLFKQYFDTHTHMGNMGVPTGPPTSTIPGEMPANTLSKKIKGA